MPAVLLGVVPCGDCMWVGMQVAWKNNDQTMK